MEIKARNVNGALSDALWALKGGGYLLEPTRNGEVVAFPEPVITTYHKPEERVLFSAQRDANPVFHLLESVWMLAGRRDVAFLSRFNSRIGQFSDDGEIFNAAYGYSWRYRFGEDQLLSIISILKSNSESRQAVLQMWDVKDLTYNTRDKSCNLSVVFDCRHGVLNITVFNRSNDLYFGAYGANAVHFSFLQEFVARSIGLPVGDYRQVSNNLHLYMNNGYNGAQILSDLEPFNPEHTDLYSLGVVKPEPIMTRDDAVGFLDDCEAFCADPFNAEAPYVHSFFTEVAHPMAMVSKVRKDYGGTGVEWAEKITASDWRRATLDWIGRREAKKQSAQAS